MPVKYKSKQSDNGEGGVENPALLTLIAKLSEQLQSTQKIIQLSFKPATLSASVEAKQGGQVVHQDSEDQLLGHTISDTQLCNVGVEASNTVNLGNYNSMRVGVSVHIPCEFNDLEKTYTLAQNWVNAKMEELQEQINEAGG